MRDAGFTLVEVVVASVLTQVVLLAVLGTLVRASELRTEAEILERAVGVAESVLDSLMALDSVAASGHMTRGVLDTGWARSADELRVVVSGPRGRYVALSGWVADR